MDYRTFQFGLHVDGDGEVNIIDGGRTLVISTIAGSIYVNLQNVTSLIGALEKAQEVALSMH